MLLVRSAEKRLARTLLKEFGQLGEPVTLIPKISQKAMAEIIGTTRSRVSYFMSRFRKFGFIDNKDRIRVHKSLLNVVLHDHMPDDNSYKSGIFNLPRRGANAAASKIGFDQN
jgi:hypothetical protein